jgi:acyl dehydratase
MGIDLELAGKRIAPIRHEYTWRDTVLYALGVGAELPGERDFVFEMAGPRVLPTFAVVPSFRTLIDVVSRLGAVPTSILHGEQEVILHRPIPPAGALVTSAVVRGIYDKGKGALVVVEAQTADDAGEPVFDNVFSIFVRGAGGFGGERGPEARDATPPDRAPDFEVSQRTGTEQAALYRLSGDLNPLHISPQIAALGGFDRPILHGLCTYGYAGRAILAQACGGDPSRFRGFAARFSGVVFPGDTLTTRGWLREPGTYVVNVSKDDGTVVLSNSLASVNPEAV